MNRKMVFFTVGCIIAAEGGFLLLPALTGLCFWEKAFWGYLIGAAICAAVGLGLMFLCRTDNRKMYAREGFCIVALGWILMSALGALPFVFTGDIKNYIDALFETASGFTTTGATIVETVENLSHASLFWRAETHWIGGMGILIIIMAFIPNISDSSIHIMKAEMPGPVVGKLVPKVKDTAKILCIIYAALTVAEFIFLVCGDMSFFESVIHAMSTAGTGGFSVSNASVGAYSNYTQWVIMAFMLLFGINFNLYYLVILGRVKTALSSLELWVFLGIFSISSVSISLNILNTCSGFGEAIRLGTFQVASIMSTSGFATASINDWPTFSQGILLVLMFFGGCAGSTAGGFKLSRVIMLAKALKREIRKLVHPRSIGSVHFEGKSVDEATISSISSYLAVYCAMLLGTFLLLCFDPVMGLEENLVASISCFNNVGPGFGRIASNFAGYSSFSKFILSFSMLAGRLEIYPILLAMLPSTWTRR